MTTILFKGDSESSQSWQQAMLTAMPAVDFRIWPHYGSPQDIEFLLLWGMPDQDFRSFPNLRAVFSLGAGVDHLLGDDSLPRGVPIVRLVDDDLTTGMSEYILLNVLRFQRLDPIYRSQQRRQKWLRHTPPSAAETRVGILGLGELGRDAALKLAALGYNVAGWSRTPKDIAGIETFTGDDGLQAHLRRTRILVCLLPLTEQTRGILNLQVFRSLEDDAFLINAGRGGHLIEQDLLTALDTGVLAGAALDVFDVEPLPPGHAFWRHPRLILTPHVASLTNPRSASSRISESILRIERGETLKHVVDLGRGY